MTYKAMRLDGLRAQFGVNGASPRYETVIGTTDGPQESREGTRSTSLGKWTINFPPKVASSFMDFMAFFHAAQGRTHSWAFRDPLDYTATSAQSILTALTATTWQMYKRWTFGAYTHDQIIILPVSGTVTVSGGGSYSISYTTGVITKSSGADPTDFVCQFDKLCRFDIDELQYTIVDKSGELLVQWVGIPIVEIPLGSA